MYTGLFLFQLLYQRIKLICEFAIFFLFLKSFFTCNFGQVTSLLRISISSSVERVRMYFLFSLIPFLQICTVRMFYVETASTSLTKLANF